ncbi:MAG: hypothetical protein MST10_07460 [Lentisphaeria bacterium]|nr:hypothetical protein [Lentisphaeria bacterium]
MFWLVLTITVISIIGMVICARLQRIYPLAQTIAVILFMAVLTGAGYLIFIDNPTRQATISEISRLYEKSPALPTVNFILRHENPGKIMFIASDEDICREYQKIFQKNGISPDNTAYTLIALTDENSRLAPGDIKKIFADNSEVEYFVFLLPFPQDFNIELFYSLSPKVNSKIILLGNEGEYDFFAKYLKNGIFSAMIKLRSDPKTLTASDSHSLENIFNSRYNFITTDNVQ